MALIEVKVEHGLFERLVKGIERIGDTLERYCFPASKLVASKPKPAEALIEFDPEREWQLEEEEERQRKLGERPRD